MIVNLFDFLRIISANIANGMVNESPMVATTGDVKTTDMAHKQSDRNVPINPFKLINIQTFQFGNSKGSNPVKCTTKKIGQQKKKLKSPKKAKMINFQKWIYLKTLEH